MVPFWDLSGHISDLTSKKIPLAAPQNLIAKLLGQQPVKNRCPLHVFTREYRVDVILWLLSSYPPISGPIKRSFFAPGWTCRMMAIQLPVRFSPVRRLPQILKEKANCFLKEAFLFFAIHSGPRNKARKRRHQVSTDCCPNHPEKMLLVS